MDEILKCSNCGEHKTDDQFHRSAKHTNRRHRSYRCKQCCHLYETVKYRTNPYVRKKHTEVSTNLRKKLLALCDWIRASIPCKDCLNRFSKACMEFDHRDMSQKKGSVSALVSSFPPFIDELLKCDIVCANCHAIRTAKQREAGLFVKAA